MSGIQVRGGVLEVLVDVLWAQASANHHDLGPVNELGHFFRQLLIALVLRRDPHFAGFFDDLLTNMMGAFIQRLNGAGALWALLGTGGQFSKKAFEVLHAAYSAIPRHIMRIQPSFRFWGMQPQHRGFNAAVRPKGQGVRTTGRHLQLGQAIDAGVRAACE